MASRVLAGRYELIEKIGEGGMAVVFKSRDRLLNRLVAIKILRPEFTKDDLFIDSFRKESQLAASLVHPNIVNIFDVGKQGNIYYIVMELIEGAPLSQLIKEQGALDPRLAAKYAKEVATALSMAHKNHLIHRDVKPHNIMITTDGIAKITDFGIAKQVNQETFVGDKKEAVMGSVHYFSPEQARGGYVDERSDIYSLGIVMYEMMTGKVPYDGETAVEVAVKHMNAQMVPPTQLNPAIPQDLEDIVLKATDKLQINRYKDADEMIMALNLVKFSRRSDAALLEEQRKAAEEKENEKYRAALDYDEDEDYDDDDEEDGPSVFASIGSGIAGLFKKKSKKKASEVYEDEDADDEYEEDESEDYEDYEDDDDIDLNHSESDDYDTYDDEEDEEEDYDDNEDDEDDRYGYEPEFSIKHPRPWVKKVFIICLAIIVAVPLSELAMKLIGNISQDKIPDETELTNLVGMDFAEAEALLAKYGLVLEAQQTYPSDTYAANQIMSQTPDEGTVVKKGQSVKVTVSRGQAATLVPDVLRKTYIEGRNAIEAAGYKIGKVTYDYSDDYSNNTIMKQSPVGGTGLSQGGSIDIVVSKGKDVDMNLLGLTESEAKKKIESSGFNVGTVATAYSDEYAVGTVCKQSPEPGKDLKAGQYVYITISKGPKPEDPATQIPDDPNVNTADLKTVNITVDLSSATTQNINLQVTVNDGINSPYTDNIDVNKSLGTKTVTVRGSGSNGVVYVRFGTVLVGRYNVDFENGTYY